MKLLCHKEKVMTAEWILPLYINQYLTYGFDDNKLPVQKKQHANMQSHVKYGYHYTTLSGHRQFVD